MTALETYSGQFKFWDGITDITGGYGVRYYVASQVGCVVNIGLLTGTYTISEVSDDNASAIFVAKYNGISIYRDFTISKSRELTGPGTAKRIVLGNTNQDFSYDERDVPADETSILTVDKFNTSAPTTWRVMRLDGSVIADGDAAALVAGGFATSSTNGNNLSINQATFNNLIIAQATNAIVFEAVVIDGTTAFRDQTTLYKLIQINKVTWESISDPTGTKAELVQSAYDASLISYELQRAVDDVAARNTQTAASLHNYTTRVERTSDLRYEAEVTAREELSLAIGNVSADLVAEQAVRASEDAALSSSVLELTADIGDVSAALTAEQNARVAADSAISSDILDLTADVGDVSAALTAEQSARATADSALSASILDLTADIGDVNAALTVEQSARASADTAISNSYTALNATVGGIRADLTTEATARANADGAQTTLYNNLNTALGTTNANLATEQTARIGADNAITTSVTTLNNRLQLFNGTGATVEAFANSITSAVSSEAETRAEQITQLEADYDGKIGIVSNSLSTAVTKLGVVENKWTLALNAGGNAITGIVVANDSNSKSVIALQADKVYFTDSSGNGTSPFYVSGGQTYIQNATIGAAAVGEAKIADAAITNAKIRNLSVSTLKIEDNAVTIPISAYTDGDVSCPANSWTTVQQASIQSSGAMITIMAFCVLRTGGGAFENLFTHYRILRNGADIFNANGAAIRYSTGQVSATPTGLMITDTPGSGWHTYTFQYQTPRTDNVQKRALTLIETKK